MITNDTDISTNDSIMILIGKGLLEEKEMRDNNRMHRENAKRKSVAYNHANYFHI